MPKSPYLKNEWRLGDVIAALQVMGSYQWASREVGNWTKKLGNPLSGDTWQVIFSEHPEFFRLNEGWASLRWRHGYDRIYDPSKGRELDNTELTSLTEEQKKKMLTRKPLSSDQIEALINAAVELHNRAIGYEQEKRYLTPLLFGLLGVILGIVLKGGCP